MKYAALVYHEEARTASVDYNDLEDIVRECGEWVDGLERNHQHIISQGLQSPLSAATIRIRNGQTSVSDGPFAETKEYLGGFTIFEARDLNEAIQIASKLPAARLGAIEVRPLLEPDAVIADPFDEKVVQAIRKVGHFAREVAAKS